MEADDVRLLELDARDRVELGFIGRRPVAAGPDAAGERLDRLLGSAQGQSIRVISSSGYDRRFPMKESSALLLATRCGGYPLDPGHGFPARLVAPGRRGYWWVKWVVALDVDDLPYWWQSPFPLQ